LIRHFTASGIVLSDDGHVLLVEHRKLGWWLYPGGHIDPGEDPAQAVLREVTEETDVSCQITAESRFSHPAATVLPAPFTICVQDIPADAGTAVACALRPSGRLDFGALTMGAGGAISRHSACLRGSQGGELAVQVGHGRRQVVGAEQPGFQDLARVQ
jgi:8-oxo-dGTP pyrophosphatase MutT (NUDIX family)